MPKPLLPVGFIKCETVGFLGPATWANVMYYAVTAGSHTPGEVIAAAAAAQHDFYHDAMTLSGFPSTWRTVYTNVSYRDADDSLVRLRVADVMVGTSVEETEAAQVAFLVNWATGDIRRGGKPRQYVPGVPRNVLADSASLTSGVVAAYNTALLTWLESLPGRTIPLQLVEMSFRNGNAWRTDAVNFPIIGVSMNPVVATQRRRVDRLRPS